MTPTGLPDIRYIRSSVPIADVAGELGLEVCGTMIRCWRPGKHQNGDRTPSVGIDFKRNRVRCFVCDTRAHSAIDLVQDVLDYDVRSAAGWIAARFVVPTIPKGRHVPKIDEFRGVARAGIGGALEMVVRSGLWSQLTPSEKAILPVLCELSDRNVEGLQLSYRGIRRFSGVGSDSSIARVLRHFRMMHVLQITPGKPHNGLPACNSYKLTLDDPQLQKAMSEIYESERRDIEAERELRKEQRRHRQAQIRNAKTAKTANGERCPLRSTFLASV